MVQARGCPRRAARTVFLATFVFGASLICTFGSPDDLQGSTRAQASAELPAFRASVTLVQIDAIVTDATGTPITGLTADDFEIVERGRRRDIVSFAAVDLPLPSTIPARAVTVESDQGANTGPPGRTYLIALDEVAPARALHARHLLRGFVSEYVAPNDLVAVALIGRGLATSGQDFTSNKRLVLAAIDKFSGGFAMAVTDERTENAAQSSTGRTVAASLRALTEMLATMPGRKVLVLVAESLGHDIDGTAIDAYALKAYRGTSLSPMQRDAHAAIAAATRGNVTIYPIDPRGLTDVIGVGGEMSDRMDLSALAEVTGGFSHSNSNNFTGAFERLVRENSSYYTLGFDAADDRTDGRFVEVSVRVRRPGLTVRSRNGYMASLQGSKPESETVAARRGAPVTRALASAVSTNDVAIRAVATSYRGAGRDATIALVVEFDVSRLGFKEKNGHLEGDVELAYLVTDAQGKVRIGERHHKSKVVIPARSLPAVAASGIRMVTTFGLPAGRYQIRIGAGGRERAGSLVHDLEVPDFTDELTLSGLALTADTSVAVPTLAITDLLGTALPGPPTASRTFFARDTLSLYVEAYDRTLVGAPTITADLRDARGTILLPFAGRPVAPRRSAPGAYGVSVTTPLATLASGEYVVHVEALGSDGRRRASREIPIRVQ